MKYEEVETLLIHLGYRKKPGTMTGGSRIEFCKGNRKILFHRPHGSNTMKHYQLTKIVSVMKEENII